MSCIGGRQTDQMESLGEISKTFLKKCGGRHFTVKHGADWASLRLAVEQLCSKPFIRLRIIVSFMPER